MNVQFRLTDPSVFRVAMPEVPVLRLRYIPGLKGDTGDITPEAQEALDQALAAADDAEAAAAEIRILMDDFDDLYLGAKSGPPTTDNDGDPLQARSIMTRRCRRCASGTDRPGRPSAGPWRQSTFRWCQRPP
jgi:hypothetical protein